MRRFYLIAFSVASLVAVTAHVTAQDPPPRPAPPPRRVPTACPSLEQLGYKPRALTDIRLTLSAGDRNLPEDCSRNLFSEGQGWEMGATAEYEFNWAASELYHQPLYFDDPILERYGQTPAPLLQPFISGAHFFGTFPLIPYKIGLDRTHDRVYTLGYFRPGSPTPCLKRRLPWEMDAAGFETAIALGLVFLVP